MSDGYPKSSVVWPGSILGYLVNSIMTAESVGFACVCSWEGLNYSIRNGGAIYGMNNGSGLYGAIVFERRSLVGIFYDSRSERAPYHCSDTYDLNRFFRGMSSYHRSIVERGPLKDSYERVDDRDIPSVTTAFWDNGEYLTAADSWDVVLAEGARLVRIELMEDIDEALAEWQEEYGMTPEQVAFARTLFQRKMAQPTAAIELTPAEVRFLESTFEDPKARYAELERLERRSEVIGNAGEKEPAETGRKWWESIDSKAEAEKAMKLCREKLAAIGILMPGGSIDAR